MGLARRNVLFGIGALPLAGGMLAGRTLPGLTATVYNGHELHTALGAAGPGSRVVLAPGDYGDIGRFVSSQPEVRLVAQVPHRTVLRSPLVLQGHYARLEGLALELEADEGFGIHLAAAGQQIIGQKSSGRGITITGQGAEVARCEISGFSGSAINVEGSAANAYIHDNLLRDARSGGVGIGVGDSQIWTNVRIGARVVNNTVQNCASGSTESIRCKSSGNTFTGNKLVNSNNISSRHGENNLYQNNVIERSMGIVVQDAHNSLVGNRVINIRKGPGIQIMCGDIRYNEVRQGRHPQAYDTRLDRNVGPVWIGRRHSGYIHPAVGTRVSNHSGSIRRDFEQNTVIS